MTAARPEGEKDNGKGARNRTVPGPFRLGERMSYRKRKVS